MASQLCCSILIIILALGENCRGDLHTNDVIQVVDESGLEQKAPADGGGDGICRKKVDIVFIVDSSGSIKIGNFTKVKKFVRDIAEAFEIGPDAAHVGVMQFSFAPSKVFFLTSDRQAALQGIDGMVYERGNSTKTGDALRFCREVMYAAGNGIRPDVPKTVIFISDGRSQDRQLTNSEAMENHLFGITTFAVGIGNTRQSELETIGSKPSETFVNHVDTFDDLEELAKSLTTKTCPPDKEPCKCWVSGDPHYHTCDGVAYDYMGGCSYVLAKTCPKDVPHGFEVQVTNELCNRGTVKRPLTCTKSVYISVYETEIIISKNGKVLINGQWITPPFRKEFENGRYVSVEVESCGVVVVKTDFGLQIKYKHRRVEVTIPRQYENKLCGLCGNFNDDPTDDAILSNGTDYGKGKSFETRKERNKIFAHVGNSWLVPQDYGKKGKSCNPKGPPEGCTKSEYKKAKKLCKPLKYKDKDSCFQRCLKKYGGNAYEDCVFDVCQGRDRCESIESFAAECKNHGLLPRNWRKLTKCPLDCGKYAKYRPEMTACPATCADPFAHRHCPQPNDEGCQCKKGYLLEAGKCIKKKTCGCSSSDGSYHKHDEKWLADGCKFERHCKGGKVCEKPYWCKKRCGANKGVVSCY